MSCYPASLFNLPSVLVDGQSKDTTQPTVSRLPIITEEIITVDKVATNADNLPVTAPVYVPDTPEPALHQGVFDQTGDEGP